MEGESKWVVNGIITLALIPLIVPLVGDMVEQTDALLLLMLLMYVVYTAMSGEAIDPHRPK